MEYYIAYSSETQQYLIRLNDGDEDTIHSSYHKLSIAQNTCRELNERLERGE